MIFIASGGGMSVNAELQLVWLSTVCFEVMMHHLRGGLRNNKEIVC